MDVAHHKLTNRVQNSYLGNYISINTNAHTFTQKAYVIQVQLYWKGSFNMFSQIIWLTSRPSLCTLYETCCQAVALCIQTVLQLSDVTLRCLILTARRQREPHNELTVFPSFHEKLHRIIRTYSFGLFERINPVIILSRGHYSPSFLVKWPSINLRDTFTCWWMGSNLYPHRSEAPNIEPLEVCGQPLLFSIQVRLC